MDDFNQIEVPPSFLQVFTTPGGHRLLQPMSTVRQRYELCEDLAQMLVEQAATARFKSDGSEPETLAKIQIALSDSAAGLEAAEVSWVVTRLAELLGWEAPGPANC